MDIFCQVDASFLLDSWTRRFRWGSGRFWVIGVIRVSGAKASIIVLFLVEIIPDFFQPRFLILDRRAWAWGRVFVAMWRAAGSVRSHNSVLVEWFNGVMVFWISWRVVLLWVL